MKTTDQPRVITTDRGTWAAIGEVFGQAAIVKEDADIFSTKMGRHRANGPPPDTKEWPSCQP